MSASASASHLIQAMKELSLEWEQTKSSWRDVKSREFEEEFLAALPQDIGKAAGAMEEIEDVLKKIRNDCE